MRKLMLVATVFCATLAAAQPSFVGRPFPLTNTRYGQMSVSGARLVSDGRDFFMFWGSDGNVRMTRVTAGERRAGKPVVSNAYEVMDVVWTGAHFLVLARSGDRLVGQLVTAAGERIGGTFPITTGVSGVRMATNGSRIVVLYTKWDTHDALWSATLTTTGMVLATQQLLPKTTAEHIRWRYAIAGNGDGFAAVVAHPAGDWLMTFDRDGEVRSLQTFGNGAAAAAIASDGVGYVVVSTAGGSNNATRVGADGTIHETTTLEESGTVTSLVHTADGWSASFLRDGHTHIAHFDESGLSMTAAEPVAVETWGVPELASSGRRAMLSWYRPRAGQYVAELPLDAGAGSPVLFGASTQHLLATAAGSRSTLFVWSEIADGRATLYAGTLGSDGVWREEILESASSAHYSIAAAASDGDGFALIYFPPAGRSYLLRRLTAEGRPLAAPVTIKVPGYLLESMIWDGNRYVITSNDVHIAFPFASDYTSVGTIDANGVFRTATEFFSSDPAGMLEAARIAWNGRNYLVVTSVRQSQATYVIDMMSLGPDLRPLTAEPIRIAHHATGSADVAWDGTNFVIVYPEYYITVRRVPTAGYASFGSIFGSRGAAGVRAATVPGGVVVTWHGAAASHVATLRQGTGEVVMRQAVLDSHGFTGPRVVPLHGSRAVFVANVPAEAAPHHGASRLHAAVLDLAPPRPLTTAPRVTVTAGTNNRLQIDWTALAQPVTGYRVEYRIGDGNWNEIERPPDPANRTATFTATRSGVTYAFRVRGMNEAGMGPYSEPAEVRPGLKKRRATR